MEFPHTTRGDVVETLHGHRIADPYRWLEDPDSAETTRWVAEQNAFTREHLGRMPQHEYFSQVLRDIVLRPSVTGPLHRSGWYLVSRNDGSRPQNTWYAARSLDELADGGEVLLDPNSWSSDGTSSLAGLSISRDGRRAVYGVSEAGSDAQLLRLLDMETGERLGESEVTARFTSPVWLADDASFLYQRYVDGALDGTEAATVPRPQLRRHTIGTDPADDPVLLEFPDTPRVGIWPEASSDGRWVAVCPRQGTEDRNKLWLYRVDGAELSEPIRVVDDFTASYELVDVVDDVCYLVTDADAARGRLVSVDLRLAEQGDIQWRTVIPESEHKLPYAVAAGDLLVTCHYVDASPVLTRWTLEGEELGRLPITGSELLALNGEPGRDEMLVSVDSASSPVQSFVVTPSTGEVRELSFLADGADPLAEISVTRHRARSADGTPVPYWLLRAPGSGAGEPTSDEDRHGVAEPVPTLMYGYGGFNVAIGASFSAINTAWVQAGGAVAIANLRGGGEFGTDWYEQGKGVHKQNVFDDFAAVARHLVETGTTTHEQLAAYGGSNGGLLVGALITQHPRLVAAAAPMVGVLDLLRFHRFTIGSAWISDYGDPDVAEDFEVALAYSPLHNVVEGEHYPATIVVTGDHDDRVVPAHSHKFAATLQHAQGGPAPILARIETSTGHGAGKPRAVAAQEYADIATFLAHHTGLRPE